MDKFHSLLFVFAGSINLAIQGLFNSVYEVSIVLHVSTLEVSYSCGLFVYPLCQLALSHACCFTGILNGHSACVGNHLNVSFLDFLTFNNAEVVISDS